MANSLASRIHKLEAEILPPTKINVTCSFVSAAEFDASCKGDNVIGRGDSWVVTKTDDEA